MYLDALKGHTRTIEIRHKLVKLVVRGSLMEEIKRRILEIMDGGYMMLARDATTGLSMVV